MTVTDSTHFWPFPRLVVHRGGGFLAPENTLDAMREAKKIGCRAVEFDIQTTADGNLVLCHDEYLGRVIQGKARVSELSSEQLKQLRVINPHSSEQTSSAVCFFDEAVSLCNELELMMNVELKPASGLESTLAQVAAAAFEKLRISVPVLVSSFSAACLKQFSKLRPQQPCGFLYEHADCNWLDSALDLHARTVHPKDEFASLEMIETAHDNGLGVMVWTVDDVVCAERLLQNGADAVCTNRPEDLMRLF